MLFWVYSVLWEELDSGEGMGESDCLEKYVYILMIDDIGYLSDHNYGVNELLVEPHCNSRYTFQDERIPSNNPHSLRDEPWLQSPLFLARYQL